MSPKAFMMLAAGNLPAAIYEDRKARRHARHVYSAKKDNVEVETGLIHYGNHSEVKLEPLDVKVLDWMDFDVSCNREVLMSCKVGLFTAGGMGAWAYVNRVERREKEIIFVGVFPRLPVGVRFTKVVLATKDKVQVGVKALDASFSCIKEKDLKSIYVRYSLRY